MYDNELTRKQGYICCCSYTRSAPVDHYMLARAQSSLRGSAGAQASATATLCDIQTDHRRHQSHGPHFPVETHCGLVCSLNAGPRAAWLDSQQQQTLQILDFCPTGPGDC